jgi:hypothetical protein
MQRAEFQTMGHPLYSAQCPCKGLIVTSGLSRSLRDAQRVAPTHRRRERRFGEYHYHFVMPSEYAVVGAEIWCPSERWLPTLPSEIRGDRRSWNIPAVTFVDAALGCLCP